MSTIVEGRVPIGRFALGDALQAVPNAEFEIMPVVAAPGTNTSLLWAAGADFERITAALKEDSTTNDVQTIAAPDGARLYRIEWTTDVWRILFDTNGAVFKATGKNNGWELGFLFSERDAVSSMYNTCTDHSLDMSIETIRSFASQRLETDLTQKQHDTLRAAYEAGYYSIPAETSLQELSRSWEISHQALSERLRRGHRALVRNAVITNTSADTTEFRTNEPVPKISI